MAMVRSFVVFAIAEFALAATPAAARVAPEVVTAVQVSAGGNHACAVTTAGAVMCWGWNGYGQLGRPGITSSAVPVVVRGLARGVAAISAGDLHTCALTTAGGVECWGSGASGELGNGVDANSSVPVA